jgi:ABC-2 type transport system permease protein
MLIDFVWIDATMNKTSMILGVVLAGGILVDEQARRSADLYLAKPVTPADYFTLKLVASWAALATFYLAAAAGALLTFPWRVGAFDTRDFVVLSTVHLFAALFSATFAGTMAVWCGHRLTGILVSLVILSTLVGLAFLGFYYPDLWAWSQLNPYFQGVVLIGSLGHYGWLDVLRPILVLIVFNAAVAAIGRHRAASLLRRG